MNSASLLANSYSGGSLYTNFPEFSGFFGFIIVFFVLMIVSNWQIFEKAGQSGWKSIVPVYSTIITLRIIRKPWWCLLFVFIPLVGAPGLGIFMAYHLAKSFGKDVWFALGLAVLPFVFYPILGFGSAEYQNSEPTLTPNNTLA